MESLPPDPATPKKPVKGLVQIYTGDGRGKTSAALGSAIRALGHGLRVGIIVFMKGDFPYGEWQALSVMPGVSVQRFGFNRFTDPANVRPEEIEQAKLAMEAARRAVRSGEFDLVILDEVNVAAAWKLVDVEEVVSLIKNRPPNVELILTGRQADERLIELADQVTECRKIKHPYDRGIKARLGFDY